jgi:uncharacterized protein YggU (UPF0235/DUF167 family)
MLPDAMGAITVRVTPRSSKPGLEVRDGRVLIRVASPPMDGRATDEARRALAGALGLAPSRVRLRSGVSWRDKVFEVEGMAQDRALRLLGG